MERRKYKPRVTEYIPKGLNKKQLYSYAKDNNLCIACFDKNDNLPRFTCKECSEIKSHNNKVKLKENREKGLCVCGHKSAEGKAKCERCLEIAKRSIKKFRDNSKMNGSCILCGEKLDPNVDINMKTGAPLITYCRSCLEKNKLWPSYNNYRPKEPNTFRRLKKWEPQVDNIEKMALYKAMEESKTTPTALAEELNVTSNTILRWVFYEKTLPTRNMKIAINEYFGESVFKVLNLLEETPQGKDEFNEIDQIESEIKQGIVCELCWKPIKDNKIPGHARKCVFCEIKLRAEENGE